MPTSNKRINISVSKDTDNALLRLARRDNMPQATKARYLIELALETEEDIVLDKIAQDRDKKTSRFVSHKKAWK